MSNYTAVRGALPCARCGGYKFGNAGFKCNCKQYQASGRKVSG